MLVKRLILCYGISVKRAESHGQLSQTLVGNAQVMKVVHEVASSGVIPSLIALCSGPDGPLPEVEVSILLSKDFKTATKTEEKHFVVQFYKCRRNLQLEKRFELADVG